MLWVQARIYDWFMAEVESACFTAWRAELLEDLNGVVLEIGAGTGANLPHYPPTVTHLVASEPDANMRAHLLQKRGACAVADVDISDASAGSLPFPDDHFDVVVCTLVLCSVPHVATTLGEVRRVLKPGGRFVFLEHVAAEDRPDRLVWQQRIEPIWKVCADGCHLTRRTADDIEAAGFRFERIERQSARKAMPLVRATIRGVAVAT